MGSPSRLAGRRSSNAKRLEHLRLELFEVIPPTDLRLVESFEELEDEWIAASAEDHHGRVEVDLSTKFPEDLGLERLSPLRALAQDEAEEGEESGAGQQSDHASRRWEGFIGWRHCLEASLAFLRARDHTHLKP